MFHKLANLETAAAPPFVEPARRRAVRYRCYLMNAARVTAPEEEPRLGWLHNLSVAGVGMLLESPLEAGTLLDINLLTAAGKRLACRGRVTHATPRADGGWLVGCAFAQPLGEDDLEALL
jgi:hypothetical protein